MVNTFIFSDEEISKVQKIFLYDNTPFANFEKALNFEDIKNACSDIYI